MIVWWYTVVLIKCNIHNSRSLCALLPKWSSRQHYNDKKQSSADCLVCPPYFFTKDAVSHKTRTISFQRITALQHCNNRLCGDICFNLDPNNPALNKAATVLYWGWENECLLEGVGEEFLLSSPCELPWRRSLRCGKEEWAVTALPVLHLLVDENLQQIKIAKKPKTKCPFLLIPYTNIIERSSMYVCRCRHKQVVVWFWLSHTFVLEF